MNYYNEFDPDAAAWLRSLIAAGLIPDGVVDERSIEDVRPDELTGYAQCHFFAGIGGWPRALQLAGWPAELPVWTGSCPCQPFSAAGKGAGFDDERHLWPAFQWLIAQRRPPVVFGEQVAAKHADAWVDLIHADLEAVGYAFGCVAFPAAGVGAPHIRDMNFWVAYTSRQRLDRFNTLLFGERLGREQKNSLEAPRCGVAGRLGYTDQQGLEGHARNGSTKGWEGSAGSTAEAGVHSGQRGPFQTNGFWCHADWIKCRDRKWRPVEPGTFPLADGLPARVVRLRGYGNAISPPAGAEFVRAFMEYAHG